jgi:hypothetical protein
LPCAESTAAARAKSKNPVSLFYLKERRPPMQIGQCPRGRVDAHHSRAIS